jgi:hypothetical protein
MARAGRSAAIFTSGFDEAPFASASICGAPFSISAAPPVLPPLLEPPLKAVLLGDSGVASGGPSRGAVSASGVRDLIAAGKKV